MDTKTVLEPGQPSADFSARVQSEVRLSLG
jgi:hypothetical protein